MRSRLLLLPLCLLFVVSTAADLSAQQLTRNVKVISSAGATLAKRTYRRSRETSFRWHTESYLHQVWGRVLWEYFLRKQTADSSTAQNESLRSSFCSGRNDSFWVRDKASAETRR